MEVVERHDEQRAEVNPNQSDCQPAHQQAGLCRAAPLLLRGVPAEVDHQAECGGQHYGGGHQREVADESDHVGVDGNPGWQQRLPKDTFRRWPWKWRPKKGVNITQEVGNIIAMVTLRMLEMFSAKALQRLPENLRTLTQ